MQAAADKRGQPADTGNPSAEEFQTGLCQYRRILGAEYGTAVVQ